MNFSYKEYLDLEACRHLDHYRVSKWLYFFKNTFLLLGINKEIKEQTKCRDAKIKTSQEP